MKTHTITPSPFGLLTLVNTDGVLSALYMEEHRHRPDPSTFGLRTEQGFEQVEAELAGYFAGEREHFTVPTAAPGTPFQHRVWTALRHIPYGQTRSYAQLAEDLGGRSLARAVGAANGRNPLSVIVPCHRLVGSDGRLTDYGGGLPAKRRLLELEGGCPRPGEGP